MAIRDTLIILMVFGCAIAGFYRPWLGVCGFAWVSYMNPHRFTWTFAYDFPVAMLIAACTLVGVVLKRDKLKFSLELEGRLLVILWLWFCVTTFFALNIDLAKPELFRVSKILFMTFVTIFLINNRYRINIFLMVIIWSVGLLAIKGGLFVIASGGAYRVYGPAGSFLEDNNDFAHALCMVLPFVIWKAKTEIQKKWKIVYRIMVVAAIASVLITYSRGGFLTLIGVLGLYWLRSNRKVLYASVLGIVIITAIPFLPEAWFERIETIGSYDQDASTLGRFNAWKTGWNVFKDRPILGGGFQTYTWKTFARYSPEPDNVHDVHSVYFEILGEQGLPGTIIFFSMIASAMITAHRLKKKWLSKKDKWSAELCDALFIALAAYLGGGLFLGRVSFDLFYHLIALSIILKGIYREDQITSKAGEKKEKFDNVQPELALSSSMN